ncbi:MAG: argininosuccinate lyase [Chloroflexi bacterium HGW-Chloroflexi-1]|nr:MAG: argininosuccinate lyase [Chloroflexi bacterium HGW-Chloroflexi-1]
MSPLWGGRFAGQTDPLMARFNASLPFDWRLWDADITGSVAWAAAIRRAGLLTEDERDQIIRGLEAVRDEIAADPHAAFVDAADEDIHSFVERRLTERIGAVAGKLHTGRSRNDQVATDVRLWLRERTIGRGQTRTNAEKNENPRSSASVRVPFLSTAETTVSLDSALTDLIRAAADRAEAEIAVLMPGYTHLQPAQPVRWSHWLLSHAWAWQRDRGRLADLARRADMLPLGSGALAGCPFVIDRAALAADLGFAAVSPNSLDAVSDRDFVAEFLFWAALLGVHLSRWAEDLILWSSREFGFVTLADAYSTGSSLMPQKKNPDSLELLRGKAGRLHGDLVGLLTTLKGLPSAYNKDLQEDKEPLFDAADTLALTLPVAQGVLETLTIHPNRMQAALGDELLATDLADALVRAGVPFRQSHHLVGRAVQRAEALGCALRALPLAELQAISPHFDAEMTAVWDCERSVEQRAAIGGTARLAVRAQIAALRDLLR